MDTAAFGALLDRFCDAASVGNGEAFAACSTETAVYHDDTCGGIAAAQRSQT